MCGRNQRVREPALTLACVRAEEPLCACLCVRVRAVKELLDLKAWSGDRVLSKWFVGLVKQSTEVQTSRELRIRVPNCFL